MAGLCNHGIDLYNKKQYADALAIFQSVRKDPSADAKTLSDATRGEAYCYVAYAQEAKGKGDLSEATRWYNEAAKILPNDKAVTDLATQLQTTSAAPTNNNAAPAPAANTAPTLLPSSPTSEAPRQNQNDFLAANAQAQANAADLLRQGNDAFKNGDKNRALELWSQAVQFGNGTPPTQDALRYKQNVTEGRMPDDDGNSGNNSGVTQ